MKVIEINISEELVNTFDLALRISSEDKDEVFKRLINQYIVDVFRQTANKQSTMNGQNIISVIKPNELHSKAYNRFPGWARKPHQTNHQIIKAFFICEKNGIASRKEMCKVFIHNNPQRASYFFENNLNSMATDAGNSHGKCFDIIRDNIKLTVEIAFLASEYRDCFVGG